MHQSVKHRRSFLRVFALLIGLAVLAINAGRAYVTVSTDSKQSSVTQDTRNRGLVLQGEPAVDHLREHGLLDRVKASVEASRYEIRWEAQAAGLTALTGAHQASNPAQNLRATFTRSGVEMAPNQVSGQQPGHLAWHMAMKLRGIGYGDEISEINSMPPRRNGNRIEFPHATPNPPHSALVEWYVNKPEGIEHGFILADPPRLKFGNEPLRLTLALTGELKASLEDEGQAVVLTRRDGKQVLRYDHLAALDALGRSLRTWMELREGDVSLLVDDSSAVYPLTIDPVFREVKKLTAADGATNEYFGFSVGISGDTIAVGAYFDDVAKGAVYIFKRNQGGADNWGQVRKLTALDGASSDKLGHSVGISGDTVVAGASGDDTAKGSAYVFERNAGGADNWGQVRKLTASDGAGGDSFGVFVGISRGTVVVGAPFDDSSNGSVYVYERNKGGAENWGEVRKLAVAAGIPSHRFGRVDIDGDAIVVGSSSDDSAKGAAYIYERNTGGPDNWGEFRKLTASDGVADDRFGSSVAINGDTIVVGALLDDSQKGSAYVFERNEGGANNWGEVKKLTASDSTAGDSFGVTVRINVATVVVGAAGDDANKGAAYIYERNMGGADNWGEVRKLMASDGAAGDQFGISVGIIAATIVVGAHLDDTGKGSAHIFVNAGNQWVEQRKQTASDGATGNRYGYSIATSGDTVVVGAFADDDTKKGTVYIYERNHGGADNWGEVKKLVAIEGQGFDGGFGSALGISGDTVVVGAHGDNGSEGSVYIYKRNQGGPDNWGEVRKLTIAASHFFGFAVGIGSDTVVVGSNGDDSLTGSAYVFERNKGGADNWGEVRRLTASDRVAFDQFGFAVGISGDTVVVGANADDTFKGSAYIYERNKGGADNWGEVRKLNASDGEVAGAFGSSVGISGDTVIAGASAQSSGGAAYIYERNKGGADNWGEVKKLTASDGAVFDAFGSSVDISGDTVVGGARGDDPQKKGAAYVFERNKGGADNWGEVNKLTAPDGVAGDLFGSVGISGETLVVGAFGDDSGKGSAYIFTVFPEAVSVSAASFQRTALAPEMIVAAFGIDLATGTEVAGVIPLPTNLLGTTVTITDSGGIARSAQLFFVSPGQVNYYIPTGTAVGPATVKITSGSGEVSFGMTDIAAISPGIFSANSTGQGIAAALALRVRGPQQTYEQVSAYDAGTGSFIPIPIDLGPAGDQVFLIMYGTGFRFRSSDSGVTVRVGGRTLQSLFSGMTGDFVGLDQMNISPLPRDLAGAGVVNIEITVDGKAANTTTVSIR